MNIPKMFNLMVLDRKNNYRIMEIGEPPWDSNLSNDFQDLFAFEKIIYYKEYEHEDCIIYPDDIVVDIGAHIGIFSIYANLMGAKEIYAFEPDFRNFQCLMYNKPVNCMPFQVAISDKTGICKFNHSIFSTGHSLCKKIDCPVSQTSNVMSLSINDIFNKKIVPKIDFIKIDVEGYEYEIISTIAKRYFQHIHKGVIEFHHKFSVYYDPLIEILKTHYDVYVETADENKELCMIFFKNI